MTSTSRSERSAKGVSAASLSLRDWRSTITAICAAATRDSDWPMTRAICRVRSASVRPRSSSDPTMAVMSASACV